MEVSINGVRVRVYVGVHVPFVSCLLSILTLTTKRKKGKVRKEGRRRVVLRYHDLFLPFRVASSLLSTRTLLSLLPTSSLFT